MSSEKNSFGMPSKKQQEQFALFFSQICHDFYQLWYQPPPAAPAALSPAPAEPPPQTQPAQAGLPPFCTIFGKIFNCLAVYFTKK